MKNLSRKLFISLSIFILGSTTLFSQWGPNQPQVDLTTFNLSRRITFTEDSENREILIPINGQITSFRIRIISEISNGELSIEIYDPNGEKQGNYSVDNQISLKSTSNQNAKNLKPTSKEIVSGKIEKFIQYPINGNWKVQIISKNASGDLLIESNQESKNQIADKPNKR